MLNFDEGKPIAMIKGGNMNNEIVYINEINKNKRRMLYDSSDSEDENEDQTYIGLDKGKFITLPKENQRECILVAGKSGSGKSTWACEYAKTYKLMYPERDLFVFSRCDVKNDPAFKGLNPLQIDINESILKNPIDIEKELRKPALVIFDDITTIQNNKIKKSIEKLVSDGLEVGRKLGITIIFCNHLLIDNDKGLARTVLHEVDKIVVFPISGNPQQIKYVLNKYFEFNDKQVSKMLKTSSRWLCINKEEPKVILSEYECYVGSNL